MKQILKAGLILSAFTILLIAPSCQTTCDNGYEGKRCDVPWRNKFTGIWTCNDAATGISLTYTDTITEGNEVTDVHLSKNFSQNRFTKFVRATIDNNTININTPQKPDASKFNVEGTGTLSSDKNTINWTYKLIDITNPAIPIDTVYTGVWVKQ